MYRAKEIEQVVMINNLVIAGDYAKKVVNQVRGKPYIQVGLIKSKDIVPLTVKSHQVLTSDIIGAHNKQESYTQFMLSSDVKSSALSAKSRGLKIVSILFRDETMAIVALDSKMYDFVVKSLSGKAK